ncbi:MAG: hypothetical protein K2P99_01685 [Burkholderiales bacterium]|nr:hypothetical protein [Burkholderiales bacterium]
MIKYKFFILAIVSLVFVNFASALTTLATPGGVGAFDNIVNVFSAAALTWQIKILPIVKYLFWFLSSLEFYYQVVIKKIFALDYHKIWIFIMVRIILISLFSQMFLDINVYISIISYFTRLGAELGGADVTIAAGSSVSIAFSPSAVFNLLWDHYCALVYGLTVTAIPMAFLSSAVASWLFNLITIILCGMLLIVVPMIILLIEAYIVLFAGFILVGFSGSSWTINYWQKYLGYVGGLAIRLFVTALLIGSLDHIIKDTSIFDLTHVDWQNIGSGVIQSIVTTLGMIFVYAALLLTIPAKAASMLNGAVNGGLGEVIGSVSQIMSGAKFTGGGLGVAHNAVKGASGLAKAATEASGVAKSASFKAMRAEMKNGISGGNGMTDTQWKEHVKSIGKNAANSAGDSHIDNASKTAKGLINDAKNNTRNGFQEFNRNSNNGHTQSSGPNININPHNH